MKMNLLAITILASTLALGCGEKKPPVEPPVVVDEKTDANVETYIYSPEVKQSNRYVVYANGEKQIVFPTDEAHICTFGCDGEVVIKVISIKGAEGAVLRPLGKNYKFTQTDLQTIVFKAKPGDRIVAEFGGSEEGQLFLFANPLR
jgi:hypothetical protein